MQSGAVDDDACSTISARLAHCSARFSLRYMLQCDLLQSFRDSTVNREGGLKTEPASYAEASVRDYFELRNIYQVSNLHFRVHFGLRYAIDCTSASCALKVDKTHHRKSTDVTRQLR